MTTSRILPALVLATTLGAASALATASAIAQTSEPSGEPLGAQAGELTPNQAIEQQVERNTLGEAAATARSQASGEAPVGSGATIEWIGSPIAAIDGTEVGTVSDVIVDGNGAVTEVRARVGGIFGLFSREVAIPAERIILEQNGILVAEMSVEEIRQARPASS